MPSKFSCRQLRETGQRFENFLVDRGQDRETDRERLRTIYNQDFKTSFGTPAPGFSSMLYGMKIANLAYVTKTRVRFFGLDRWADVWFPEKRRMKPGLEMSKHHRSLLATIFHDRAEYMHGKHGVNVEVQGPHEARDGQLLIRLDLNRKEVLTLRLRNGGTQPVTLTHLFPFCRTPQFSFCNGDRELPCLLGPGECYELHVHCKTSFVGYFPATVLWELLGPGEPGSEGAGTFYIARFLACGPQSPGSTAETHDSLQADPGRSQPCGDQPDRGRRETRPC